MPGVIVPGFSGATSAAILATHSRLRSHLPGFQYVGGVVTRSHLPPRRFNGLDVATGVDPLPAIRRDFLLAIRHPDGYWAIVDRRNGVKVNLFPARHTQPAVQVTIGGSISLPFQPIAEQVVSILEDLLKLERTPPRPVDPKQFADFEQLLAHRSIDLEAIRVAWTRRHSQDPSFDTAAERAETLRQRHPELIRPGLYTSPRRRLQQLFARCPHCISTPDYPLDSLWRVTLTMALHRRR